jgi:hypothetical protein
MKNLMIIVAALVFCVSCKTTGSSRSEKRERKEAYVYSFKMTYFKKMLLVGFGNSPEIKAVLNEDHSNYGETILSVQDFQFIDSVVVVDKAKLTADSAASMGRVAEGAAGKRVFDGVLKRYQSKWLNNIAAKRAGSYTDLDIAARKPD